MKNQALFSSKDKSKKLKCRLLQFLFGTLRVKVCMSRLAFLHFLRILMCFPDKMGSTLNKKNLLQREQILPFKS